MRPTYAPASAEEPLRIAAIDWAMLETVMALGLMPIAATELIQFRKDAVEPAIPDTVTDLGLRGSPNFELLQLAEPDLILSSPFYTRHQPALERIAPVFSLPFYVRGDPPLAKARDALQLLGDRLGLRQQADDRLVEVERQFDGIAARLSPYSRRPTYLINIGDARHFRAFGADSMFGNVLDRLALPNAWTENSRFSFAAPVPLEQMAAVPEARIAIISDIPVEARSGLADSMIWNKLDPVRAGRVVNLANVNPYGGITAAMRFATLLAQGLEEAGPDV
ncbi:ABC transporter substrate-binding protein [Rhizobium sp. SSA_523]|uniref:ABC transporter substrate-binding protein n=1 Tax=Rhizobium sp. SSA_523 TaxID=2952477 RepID=UPI0020913790|nr:ABC transporter substrate-binding protein [Rhizobium sp. SSA_523]MCO5734224.1 ABC transporter substrate-binding protein [Rhizobium sp. SSA_523]WKC21497.1 ABC transporter substrate-binding protein [Rhizobium sp. SSA_523]